MFRAFCGAALIATALACSRNSTGPTDGGVDSLTATIDGQSFTATVMAANVVTVNGAQSLSIVGFNGCQGDTSFSMNLRPVAVGTHVAGQSGINASGGLNRMAGGQSTGVWQSTGGSITISMLSSTRVAGTFAFPVLTPLGGGTTGNRSIANGSFNIQIAERKLC